MPTTNGNNAASEPLEAICRCLYLIFTGPSTNAQLIQHGNDILAWYSNPAVTGDAEAVYQLDTVRDVWKAELPKEADAETLGTMQSLRERIQEASDKVKIEYIRIMPGYTAGQIRGLLAGLRAKHGPGSAAPTDLELQIMAHQLMVYYHHWDGLDDQTKRDLDYAYYLWEQKVFEAGPAEHLRQVAAELTAKQLACSR
ncbi:hypothetical protein VFPBJ_06591 [Purpureocillium lilacinum]|uniref:Uncharacterized protein n=1 Tax=Purpureocillium lilacinum TaxID=33203 RepID=A0A179GM53_PURLI|nr:hypothetical protein VFPBJ_06591 [Purpureocillium lilacinum]